MADEKSDGWRIALQLLPIALLPTAVLVGSDFLLTQHGRPELVGMDPGFKLDSSVAAHAEAAARIRIIAGFLLFVAAAAAVTGYFAVLAARMDRFSLVRVFAVAAALVVVCGTFIATQPEVQTQELVGQRFMCAAASHPHDIALVQEKDRVQPDSGRLVEDVPKNCGAARFIGIRNLIKTEFGILLVAIPAAIFGAILSLAAPRRSSSIRSAASKQARSRLLQLQIDRLNTVLYLSAFLMVGGLLFLSAFLHYPAFLFAGPRLAAFQQHVGSIVLFYAVSYSLLIAAFYVPLAAILVRECAVLKNAGGAELEGSGMLSTAQMLKVGGAIFSPLIAGALGEVLVFPL